MSLINFRQDSAAIIICIYNRKKVYIYPILCYAWSQQSTKEEKKEHSIFFHPKLALQALCLLLPRFCVDITSHPRGCISDATMSVMRTLKPVWT